MNRKNVICTRTTKNSLGFHCKFSDIGSKDPYCATLAVDEPVKNMCDKNIAFIFLVQACVAGMPSRILAEIGHL